VVAVVVVVLVGVVVLVLVAVAVVVAVAVGVAVAVLVAVALTTDRLSALQEAKSVARQNTTNEKSKSIHPTRTQEPTRLLGINGADRIIHPIPQRARTISTCSIQSRPLFASYKPHRRAVPMTIRPTPQGRFPKLADGIHSLALGNGTQFEVLLADDKFGTIVLGVFGYGLWRFTRSACPSYIVERLKVCRSDAGNLCDFLRDQFGSDMRNYGSYDPDLCQPQTNNEY